MKNSYNNDINEREIGDKNKDNIIDTEDFKEQYDLLFSSTMDIDSPKQNKMKSSDLNIDKELAHSKNNIKINERKNFLSNRKWECDSNELDNKINVILEEMNMSQLKELQKQIRACNLDVVYNNNHPEQSDDNLGTLSSLDFLIETTYYSQPSSVDMMFSDKEKLEKYLYKYRPVLGDGDCFYRGIIFSFLENIILTNNLMLMKEILILFNEKINKNNPLVKTKEYLSPLKILKTSIVNQALYTLVKEMEKNDNDTISLYEILLKLFIYCKDFDYGIIYFTRYLLYEYISLNEDKIFSKDTQIELGCFLPEEFVKDKGDKNEYFFEKFYTFQLMKPKTFAEKIVIYIIPFVFNVNLNILIYDYGANSFIEEKKFESENSKYEINLLFRKNHYDIYYKKDFYSKYNRILDRLLNIFENICFLNSKIPKELLNQKNNQNKDNNQSEVDEHLEILFDKEQNNHNNISSCLDCKKNYEHKENVFGLCNDCLLNTLKTQILTNYIEYIKKGINYMGNEERLHSFFRSVKCSISNYKDIPLQTAIFNSGYKFEDLFLEIRKINCLYCGNSLINDNFYVELPCNCRICKKECFEEYINYTKKKLEIRENQKGDKYFLPLNCYCGYNYNLNSLIYMINEMKKKELKDEIKMYQQFLKQYCKWKCMICQKNFNIHYNYFRLFFTDDKIDKQSLNMMGNKHLICQFCARQYSIDIGKDIFCFFCKSKHIIENIKEVNYNNEVESDCIII